MTKQSRPERTEADIYKDVGKHRWPYVDEPRPHPRNKGRPGDAGVPAAPAPTPRPLTPREAVDAG